MSDDSVQLLERWRNGDEQAAAILFDRYVDRLLALARSRLSERMQRRVGPEDVVQLAYGSFFRRTSQQQYTLEKSGDLWGLLAAITITKLQQQVEFHSAQKRRVYAEESQQAGGSTFGIQPQALVQQPTPAEAAAMIEEVKAVMEGLDPLSRRILELALQNASIEEISDQIHRSGRTVRRVLQSVREQLEKRLLG